MREIVPQLLSQDYEPKSTIKDLENLLDNPAWADICDFIAGHTYKLRNCLEEAKYEYPALGSDERVRGALYVFRLMERIPADFIEDIKSAQKLGGQENGPSE